MTATHAPLTPRQRTAAGTPARELERLALSEQMHPSCTPLTIQAHIWVMRAYNALNTAQAEELRPLDLSPSAFNVLMALANTPGGTLEPCQLAERLLVSRPSITGLLDTLQHKGFVQRRPHPQDRRRVLVELTDSARDLLAGHFDAHYAEQAAMFADLSDDELDTLVGLLRKIRGATPPDLADERSPSAP